MLPIPGWGALAQINWARVALVAAFAVWTAAAYWAGGRGPRADLEKDRADVRAARAEQEADDQVDAVASAAIAQQIDEEHDERHARLNRTWNRELDRVRDDRRRVKPAGKPVRERPEVCADAAGNDRLSGALESYREGVRDVIRAERVAAAVARERAGRLLAICHGQAGDLAEVVDWYGRSKALWERSQNDREFLVDDPPVGGLRLPGEADPGHWMLRLRPDRKRPEDDGALPDDQVPGPLEGHVEPGGLHLLK